MSDPIVSIGVPVYNGEKFLPTALSRLLAQDFENFELIVSDNASTDATEEICRRVAAADPRVRYVRSDKNVGLAANHNQTFALARGRYFKWAAADDDFPPAMISRFVEAFDSGRRDVSLVYSLCEYIDEDGVVVGIDSDGIAKDDPSPRRRLSHLLRHVHMYNAMYGLIRADVLRKTRQLGLYPGSDYVLLSELAMLGVLVEIPEPLLRIRRHSGRSFNANATPATLRELFAPGQRHASSNSLRTRMITELVESAWRVPRRVPDRLACTAVALTKPYLEAFRSFGGRMKRWLLSIGSSARPAYRAGDLVEVLSKEEILATLDKNGQLDGLPFMPEMFAYCGRIMRVSKRAHKTCDTAYGYKGLRLKDAVHLEDARCNGEFHAQCEAGCLLFFKTAWVRSLARISLDKTGEAQAQAARRSGGCSEADVFAGAMKAGSSPTAYVCQATRLQAASQPLQWWTVSQYVEDYTSGNVSLWRMIKSFAYKGYRRFFVNLGIGLGPAMVATYDALQRRIGGTPYPHRQGKVPAGSRTPDVRLNLQAGEHVRVRSYDEICETIDTRQTNRGMTFDKEMVPYCGGTYRVLRPVRRILNEQTGEVQLLKNPCIILDGVVCQARYSECRLFCPRAAFPFWREAWLERVPTPPGRAE